MPRIEWTSATPEDREALLAMMEEDLAARIDRILTFLGLTWPELEEIFQTRGEVRTLCAEGVPAGYCWIEHRDRELHLHALFVLPEHRGHGIGGAALRSLERELGHAVDFIELGVEVGNQVARALYRREGYEVVRELPEIGFEIMRKRCAGRTLGGSSPSASS